jgi:hypothetical protein
VVVEHVGGVVDEAGAGSFGSAGGGLKTVRGASQLEGDGGNGEAGEGEGGPGAGPGHVITVEGCGDCPEVRCTFGQYRR